MRETLFKLYCESLGISGRDAANIILKKPYSSVSKYITGSRNPPQRILDKMEAHIRHVDSLARAFRHHPEGLARSSLPAVLHKAARRRMLEIALLEDKDAQGL